MILITGATGFVGHKLMQDLENTIAAPSLRGATEEYIKRVINENDIDVIIHTAAISDIGTCENDPDASHFANVEIPLCLARAAEGRKLIFFSSDQVYSGCREDGPYTEETVNPANTYAKHKLEMENRVLDILPSAVMLRAEWMYDYESYKGNYFLNMMRATDAVAFSSKQYRGITYLKEVSENMEKVIALPGGVYNFGSETTKSMYEITKEFLAYIKKDIVVNDAPARHNLWMNCEKARRGGVIFSDVSDALKKCERDAITPRPVKESPRVF